MSELPRKILLPLAAAAALTAAACNTVAGAGEDLESAGAAVTETAEEVEEDLTQPDPYQQTPQTTDPQTTTPTDPPT